MIMNQFHNFVKELGILLSEHENIFTKYIRQQNHIDQYCILLLVDMGTRPGPRITICYVSVI